VNRIILVRQPISQKAMQRQLEQLFQRQFGQPQARVLWHEESTWQPPIDVYETDEAFIVLAELAGMRDSEIEITLSSDGLFLAGRRPEIHPDGTLRFHRLGINEGPFQAAVLLPGPINEDNITADYDDGLLTVTLPKRPHQTRRIEVTNR